MAWTLTDDVDAFQAAAGGLLGSEPVRNTVQLSVLASLTTLGPIAFGDEAPLFGWWTAGGAVSAAVLQTPPHPMLLTGCLGRRPLSWRSPSPTAACGFPASTGPNRTSPRSAGPGSGGRGHRATWGGGMRLYRLGGLVPPDPGPDGAARIGTEADEALVTNWFAAFAAEVGDHDSPGQVVRSRLASGQLMLWESAGQPRSLAGVTAVISGVARVGPVYTPLQWRGRGYGGAVTAAISELALARGAEAVILFTDLANPASNSLYIKLGYEARRRPRPGDVRRLSRVRRRRR